MISFFLTDLPYISGAEMPALLAKKEEVITILKQENSEEKENTLRVKAEAEEERQRLLDRIQQLADELPSVPRRKSRRGSSLGA